MVGQDPSGFHLQQLEFCGFVVEGSICRDMPAEESFDLQEARRMLDEDHRGLEKASWLLIWTVSGQQPLGQRHDYEGQRACAILC